MIQTYKATGINLKGMPLGEADRLVSVLTPEYGLIRAVVPGARKHKSTLRGRSELFVVNELLIVKGRSLDKIIQANTIESYSGLSGDLGKLAASQYLAEVVLCLALSEQPQTEIYQLLLEHLKRFEILGKNQLLFPYLAQALFHLLALAGIGPTVHACCLTQQALTANFTDPNWRVGFSFDAGGLINLSAWNQTENQAKTLINTKIGAIELTLLQQLSANSLPQISQLFSENTVTAWVRIERILRDYAQYHFGRSIRSAAIVESLYPLEF